MHFTTFVAFMLPLAALAAPTTTPQRDSGGNVTQQLNTLRFQFGSALTASLNSVNGAINSVDSTRTSHHREVLNDANFASTHVTFTIESALRVARQVAINGSVPDSDQLDVALGAITSIYVLTRLNQTLQRTSFISSFDLDQLFALQTNVSNALQSSQQALGFGEKILELQNTSVTELFQNANVTLPPKFLLS